MTAEACNGPLPRAGHENRISSQSTLVWSRLNTFRFSFRGGRKRGEAGSCLGGTLDESNPVLETQCCLQDVLAKTWELPVIEKWPNHSGHR